MTLQDFITGRHPLPLTRQHRRLKTRRIILDHAADLFPHGGLPIAWEAARAAAEYHARGMADAMLSDPRLHIDLVETARHA